MLAPLIPIPPGKKGGPYLKNWEKLAPEVLDAELKKRPGCNLGLRLDHFLALDPDSKEAVDYLAALETDQKLPPTVTWSTWRGHPIRLYDRPAGLQPLKINHNGLNLELRTGAGQYVLTPPSQVNTGQYRYAPHLSPDDIEVAALPPDTLALLKSLINNINAFSINRDHRVDHKPGRLNFTQGHRDDSLFHVANCLTKGGMAEADIIQVLNILGIKCTPPFSQKDILEKIMSAERRQKARERSIAEEVREWVLTTTGQFVTTDVYKDLDLTTRDHKKAAVMALLRLEDDGLLEKCGEKRGCYRRIERNCEALDFLNASPEVLPIKWPFELEKLVNIYRRNLIVVAGAPNAGKTALLLNVARLNMGAFPVYYFSSEMGQEELRLRLEKFDFPLPEWTFRPYERAANFADAIRPESINIVDFLELTDNFYKVAGELKAIFDRLTTGIAIVGIQKKGGATLGRGGDFSLEKARLYLSMDAGELRVIKAKNWAQPGRNPNGLVINFKLVSGARFIEISRSG